MVSAIGDNFKDTFPNKWPQVFPIPTDTSHIDRAELAELRKEVEELKKLLKAAKKFDDSTGQPECHMDEKMKLITDLARLLGIDMGDVFKATGKSKK
jgi:hypothetical protein